MLHHRQWGFYIILLGCDVALGRALKILISHIIGGAGDHIQEEIVGVENTTTFTLEVSLVVVVVVVSLCIVFCTRIVCIAWRRAGVQVELALHLRNLSLQLLSSGTLASQYIFEVHNIVHRLVQDGALVRLSFLCLDVDDQLIDLA